MSRTNLHQAPKMKSDLRRQKKRQAARDVKRNNSLVIVERKQELLWALKISFFVVSKRASSLLCIFILCFGSACASYYISRVICLHYPPPPFSPLPFTFRHCYLLGRKDASNDFFRCLKCGQIWTLGQGL